MAQMEERASARQLQLMQQCQEAADDARQLRVQLASAKQEAVAEKHNAEDAKHEVWRQEGERECV